MNSNFPYDDFFSILESSCHALVGFNAQGNIIFTNNYTQSLCGYSKEELLGMPFSSLLPSEEQVQKKDGSLIEVKKCGNKFNLKHEDITFISFVDPSLKKQYLPNTREETELLYKMATLSTQNYSLQESLSKMLSFVCKHLGWPIGHVYLVNEEKPEEVYPSNIWYLEDSDRFQKFKEITMKTHFKIGEGLPGRILETGKVEWNCSVLDKNNFFRAELYSNLELKKAFGFPIYLEGKVVCILEFFTCDTTAPDETLFRLMDSVSQQVSLVFQKRSQEKKLTSKALEMELLYKAASLATKNYSIEESLRKILGYICENVGWPVGHVYLVSKKTPGELYPSHIWHFENEEIFQNFKKITMRTKFKIGIGLPGRIFKSGKAEWITNVQEDTNFPRARSHLAIGVKGAFGFPVQVDGKITCILEFFTPSVVTPNYELLKVMDTASQQISLVFQKKKAQSELKLALETKSRFLATMSHEIRTPIAVIIGAAELIDTKELKEDQKVLLEKLKTNSKSLLKLVTNILDFSKGESNLRASEDIEINLQTLANQLSKTFSTIAKNKKITFSIHLEESLPKTVMLDIFFIERILINLIENAFKFTKKGNIRLEISKKENMLYFLVKDTGIGIPKKDFPHIFDKFCQTNSKDSREVGGSGLGLSICKHLVSLLGGKISVSSIVGEGSCFTFTTLLKEPNVRVKENKEAVIDPKKLYGQILLAEDNEDNQLIINHFLKKTSCNIDLANDGVEALEMIKKKKYDLILMDMQMPVMDGYSATKAIRALEKEKHTIVIALTANALEEDKQKCLDAGCDAYLSKPINSRILILELSKWLK